MSGQSRLFADAVTDAWTIGFSGLVSSGQHLFGDEANLSPKTNLYVVLNANTRYRLTRNIEFFGLVQNLLNVKYKTLGTFSPTSAVP